MSGVLVIKIGGSTLGSADTTFRDIAALVRSGDVPVVVHGGGAEASRWLDAMNIPSRFERGLWGPDGRILECPIASPELGFVGEPAAVHPEAIEALRGAGIIPVIGPIGYVPGSADR